MLAMKNQDMNPLDENFQLKDPTKRPDKFVMELGSNHYYTVRNKSKVASWRYDHNKNLWLITRESGTGNTMLNNPNLKHGRRSTYKACYMFHISIQVQTKEAEDGHFMLSLKGS
ncbi:hypothetical protein Hanom_Chr12g01164181 [Helianthus anomalus]